MSRGAHGTDAALVAAAVSSSLGLVVHNLGEFGSGILLRPETLGPLLVTAALVVAASRRPDRGVLALLAAFGALHLFVGGLSVLPLRILPFVPEQTVSHYGSHVVYAGAQLPLLWTTGSRLGLQGTISGSRSTAGMSARRTRPTPWNRGALEPPVDPEDARRVTRGRR